METLLILLAVQGVLGAFDMFYHHELTERLAWRKSQARELQLHGVRNFFYALMFLSLGWMQWLGLWAWVFGAVAVIEVVITLIDFVEEDRSRKLPATERVTHTVLALNYGAVLALFAPIWWQWAQQPTGFAGANYGWLSWLMTVYACGVLPWGFRDLLRGNRLARTAHLHHQPRIEPLLAAKQRILVTGGTGFLGVPLCQHLINGGHEVTLLTRDKARAAGLFTGRVTCINSLNALPTHAPFDIVINFAGEPISQRWTAARRQAMRDSRIAFTRTLVEWMAQNSHKPDCFISGSAIGIYGVSETDEFTEDSPRSHLPVGLFARQLCEDWEEEAQRAEALGVRTCLLRIGIVLEVDGGALSQMLVPFDLGLGGKMGNGKQWFSWVHRDDVLRLAVYCINHNELRGAFNACAPHPVTNRDFSRALGKAMQRPALLPLPAIQVKLLFGKMGECLLLSGQKVLPQRAIKKGFVFQYPILEDALDAVFAPWLNRGRCRHPDSHGLFGRRRRSSHAGDASSVFASPASRHDGTGNSAGTDSNCGHNHNSRGIDAR